ncbi:hypothetical protein EUTSA_v10006448mg [Eutrema salsugineum]|uniref:F-box domain-containing protein n=1 Tax=Eutrema salsugineum TaxID=72664 RepID=V4LPC8_EUTSA|nr:hypothetical protein EUTSA_v10006448mg [Eutrema salsugineum]
MEKIPDVLIEYILERLGVKYLVRFTTVLKQWNSMIKSTYFASTHLIRAQSRNPLILLGGCSYYESSRSASYSYLRTLELLGCPISKKIHTIPKPKTCLAMTRSCDGLVCVYDFQKELYVINPATRWCRSLPRAKFQQINRIRENLNRKSKRSCLGFGKDTMTNKYKMMRGFEFTTNAWRHVIGSPHRICDDFKSEPVYLDGSLHWFTVKVKGETKIVYFDLHTEVFHVMSEIPIAHASPSRIIMWSLNNRLCVLEKKINSQVIWSLNSHNVWEKTYSITLNQSCANL